MERLLHTPEGVRDIYGAEDERKRALESGLLETIRRYGYRTIQTPTFEFFDVFSRERGTVPSREMYKFFDREGNTLVLRPDGTPPIARCIAKYYREETLPVRLCYLENTFINNSEYQGKWKETTQLGAELVFDASVEADAEILALVVECLLKAGLKEFQVEVGNAEFFRALVAEAGLTEQETEELRDSIINKNRLRAEQLMRSCGEEAGGREIKSELAELILKIPELYGSMERLAGVKQLTKNPRALQTLARLEQLYELMRVYGFERYITFDLGALSKYDYYTGVIFQAYTYGTGNPVITGGRYDSLIGQFGLSAPAIGMAIHCDELLWALRRRQEVQTEEIPTGILLLYEAEEQTQAIQAAAALRAKGRSVQLQRRLDLEPAAYEQYAKRHRIGRVLRLEELLDDEAECGKQ